MTYSPKWWANVNTQNTDNRISLKQRWQSDSKQEIPIWMDSLMGTVNMLETEPLPIMHWAIAKVTIMQWFQKRKNGQHAAERSIQLVISDATTIPHRLPVWASSGPFYLPTWLPQNHKAYCIYDKPQVDTLRLAFWHVLWTQDYTVTQDWGMLECRGSTRHRQTKQLLRAQWPPGGTPIWSACQNGKEDDKWQGAPVQILLRNLLKCDNSIT